MSGQPHGADQIDKADQKRFYDEEYGSGKSHLVYAIVTRSRKEYADIVIPIIKGKRVLDFGCGPGVTTVRIAEHAAEAVGIDISEAGIEKARTEAAEQGVTNITFEAMDGEAMTFADNSFDVVCGLGIIHHLHLEPALREVSRVMKPDGKAVFVEPLGHNPLANIFRRLTPSIRPKDEYPIRRGDFPLFDKYFASSEFIFSNLLAMFGVHLQEVKGLSVVYRALRRLDDLLFKVVPPSRFLAQEVTMILGEPRNQAKP